MPGTSSCSDRRIAATRGRRSVRTSRTTTREQMGENPSAIPYQTIVAMAESPRKKDLLYVGTDDGRLHTTIDGGKEWTELTLAAAGAPLDLAPGAVAARGRHRVRHAARPRRRRLRRLSSTSPRTSARRSSRSRRTSRPGPVNVIREDPRNPNVLYAGTDFGVFVSTNGGAPVGRARRQPAVGAGLRSAVPQARQRARDLDLRPRHVGDGRLSVRREMTQPPVDDPLWYKDAVIYQVHVRAFFDSNDDGVGDFRGPDAASSTTSSRSASPRSGCCPSIRRRSATTATTSPTTRACIRRYGTLTRLSRRSWMRRTRAACASSPSSSSTTRRISIRGSRRRGARQRGIVEARLLRLERHGREVRRRADHLQGHRAIELDVGSGRRAVLTGTASSTISPI